MKENPVNFVGIDISKEKFDVAIIIDGNKDEIKTNCFEQTKSGFEKLQAWVMESAPQTYRQTFYCMEHTGIYNLALVEFLCERNISVCVEHAKQIKLSMGLQRGKSDKIDARRIALYAHKNIDDIHVWQMPRKELQLLKALLNQRNLLVQTKINLEQNINELCSIGLVKQAKQLSKYNKGVKGIKKDIEKIEADIQSLIKQDEALHKMVKQITSIPGVGLITAMHLIVYTNEFKAISNGKQLACYCGVAPFEYSSGKSVKGKSRVSHAANKTLKTLLHMCALTAIKVEGEFKVYYERKKAEGKNGMLILNAIRNKILLRIAALIKGEKMYVENYVYNA